MRPIRVEFRVRRVTSTWLWVALILALAALATDQGSQAWQLHKRVIVLRREDADLMQRIEHLEKARAVEDARRNVLPPYAKDAAAVAKLAKFPLDRVLTALEATRVLGVRVSNLEVSAPDETARIELEFVDHSALMTYLESINAGEPKPRWTLVQAQMPVGSATAVSATRGTATLVSNWRD